VSKEPLYIKAGPLYMLSLRTLVTVSTFLTFNEELNEINFADLGTLHYLLPCAVPTLFLIKTPVKNYANQSIEH